MGLDLALMNEARREADSNYSTTYVRLVRDSQKVKSISEFEKERIKALPIAKERAEKEAQKRRDQDAADERYRRDAPARQNCQMCEAQKRSCYARCPTYNSSYRDNSQHFNCQRECGSISCN